jgi:hypothetical protein
MEGRQSETVRAGTAQPGRENYLGHGYYHDHYKHLL